MGIPERQLEGWSNDGATGAAQLTHTAIRQALRGWQGWPADLRFEDYLQGSYRNSTTIRSDSDVDIVVEMTPVYYSNEGITSIRRGGGYAVAPEGLSAS